MVWIKICGITNLEDARMASRLKVDSIGFVLSTDSPRRIEINTAGRIIEALRSEGNMIPAVGVFVNEETKDVLKYSKSLGLDYVQLSGDENNSYLKKLKEKSGGLKIIKSIRIKDNNKDKNKKKEISYISAGKAKIYQEIESFKGYADFILFDSYRNGAYGGTGDTFNWDIIKYFSIGIPVILSGGLDGENVRQAVDIVKPFGVDASSRLEICPGKKDPDKVRRFVNAIRL